MIEINNQVALVTGGTKGIGKGIVEALLAEGVKVAFTGRSDEGVQKAVTFFEKKYTGQFIGIVSDVRNLDSQIECVQQIKAKWGKLNVLVANAGVGYFGSVENLTPEQWKETIDINLTGVFYSLKAAFELLKASEGYFITISSLAGTNFFAGGAAYNASKFGLTGFTQAAMLDLRQYGIKTTTIMPGSVATYFNNHEPSDADSWKIQVEDLGQLVVDLLKIHPRTLPSKVEVRPTKTAGM